MTNTRSVASVNYDLTGKRSVIIQIINLED